MQQDIWEYYQSTRPGEVQVIAFDLFNCTAPELADFRDQVGATFPLLLDAASPVGGNIFSLYGERDHYVIVNKQGIVRYQGNQRWPYGNGYHLAELRACIDSLVAPPVDVDGAVGRAGVACTAQPNPFRERLALELVNSSETFARARVRVFDMLGRQLATLLDRPVPRGRTALEWSGHDERGATAPPGVYRVRVDVAGVRRDLRVVRIR